MAITISFSDRSSDPVAYSYNELRRVTSLRHRLFSVAGDSRARVFVMPDSMKASGEFNVPVFIGTSGMFEVLFPPAERIRDDKLYVPLPDGTTITATITN